MTHKPLDIRFKNVVTEAKFIPISDRLVTAHMNGHIRVYKYIEDNKPKREASVKVHSHPVRSFILDESNRYIYSCSHDSNIYKIDMHSSTVVQVFRTKSHDLAGLCMFDKTLISASSDGHITVFDTSTCKVINEIKTYQLLSCIISNYEWKTLLYTSSEGYMHAYSLKNWKLLDKSDLQDDEYTCGSFLATNKIVFGSSHSNGRFCVYNRNEWGNPCDVIYTGTSSIEHVASVNENSLIFSTTDGFVGSYRFYPSYLYGYMCKNFPAIITSLSITLDSNLLMISHEEGLTFLSCKHDLHKNNVSQKSYKKQKVQHIINNIKNGTFFSDI